MQGKELLLKLASFLQNNLNINNQELSDNIGDESLDLALDNLISLITFPNLRDFINEIKNINQDAFINQDIEVALGGIDVIDFNELVYSAKNRAFYYSNTEFGFFSSKTLFENGTLVNFSEDKYNNLTKQILEYISVCFKDGTTNADKINEFISCIKDADTQKGFIIIKQTTATLDCLKIYHYIYMDYLKEANHIEIPHELIYTLQPRTRTNLLFDNTKDYEQFLDIFDVLNELNKAEDILTRFLKLYHALEYLVYRAYLVKLATRVANNKNFVREFIKTSDTRSKNEKEDFRKHFLLIFPTLPDISANFTVPEKSTQRAFLEAKNIPKSFDFSKEKIADFIYGIRCCIVHNKESEFHLTLSNYEEYKVIIPLIKVIIDVLEDAIIQKIANSDDAITYTQQTINLY